LPEPLIPAKRITKGFLISKDSLIVSRKFGGSIRIDSMDSFSSFLRSTSLRIFPIRFVPRDSFIDWTASYATLFWRRIISSSWKSSSNFSSVSRFLNFEKKPFSSIGVSIVFSRDCSNSSFGFFISFFNFLSASFLVALTLIFFVFFGVSTGSSVFFIHSFSFSFSLPNMFF